MITVKKKEKGSSAIEFVLILPVILTILIAIIEYGWLFKTQIELNNAVSAAGNAVIQNEGYATPVDIALSAINEAMDLSGLNSFLSVTIYSDPSRAEIALSNWPYNSLAGMLPANMLPSTISAKTVMAYP